MATAWKDGPKWRGAYRDPSGKQVSKSFTTKGAAVAWATEREVEIRRGDYFDPRAGTAMLGEFAEAWLDARVVERTTEANDASRYRTHIAPTWERVPLGRVRASAVQAWIKGMTRKGLAPATVGAAVALLSGILEAARKDRIIAVNACKEDLDLPVPREGREVYLTRREVDLIASAMVGRRAEFDRAILYMLAYSGLRWGELVGLGLPRVDLMRQRIRVAETVIQVSSTYERKDYPKGRKQRTVPIADPLVPVVAEHIRRYPPYEDELGLLLFRPAVLPYCRAPVLGRCWSQDVFRPAVERALSRTDVRVHDLRHTFASWLVLADVSLYKVQVLLGHESPRTTQRYAHLAGDDLGATLRALSRGPEDEEGDAADRRAGGTGGPR